MFEELFFNVTLNFYLPVSVLSDCPSFDSARANHVYYSTA
jgi:hypothetical protein